MTNFIIYDTDKAVLIWGRREDGMGLVSILDAVTGKPSVTSSSTTDLKDTKTGDIYTVKTSDIKKSSGDSKGK